MNGAASAAGFYLGLEDDVAPKLKGIRQEYRRLLRDIVRGNLLVQKHVTRTGSLTEKLSAAQAASALSAGASSTSRRKIAIDLKPKQQSRSMFRALFGSDRDQRATMLGKLRPMAKGGLVNGPTSALVGESGKELVLPIERGKQAVIDLFEAAIKSAGGAARTPVPSNTARGMASALVESEKSFKNIVGFLKTGNDLSIDLEKDAKVLAGVIGNISKTRFKDEKAHQRFVDALSRSLIPAMEQGRGMAESIADEIERAGKGGVLNKIGKTVGGMGMIAALDAIDRASSSFEQVAGFLGVREQQLALAKMRGVSFKEARKDIRGARGAGPGMQFMGGNFSPVTGQELGTAQMALFAAGFRDFGNEFGNAMTRVVTDAAKFSDLTEDQLAPAAYQLAGRLNLSADATRTHMNEMVDLERTYKLSSSDLLQANTAVATSLQSLGLDAATNASILRQSSAAAAAFGESFIDIDVGSVMSRALTPEQTMRSAALMGVSQDAFRKDVMGTVLGATSPLFKQLAGAQDAASQMAIIQQISARTGGLFDAADPAEMLRLAKAIGEVGSTYQNSFKVMAAAPDIVDTSQLSNIEKVRVAIENLASKDIPFLGGSLTDVVDMTNDLDLFKIGSGIAGISMAMGPLGKGMLWIATTPFKLLHAGLIVLPAKLLGLNLGLKTTAVTAERTGASFGSAFGKGFAQLMKGAGMGIQFLLKGAAGGLKALAVPQVAVGTLVFIGIAGGLWILAKAVQATAPAITALLGGIADVVGVTLGSFAVMDWKQMLAAGPAMATIGIGFMSMATGLVGGIAILTAGDLVSRVGRFFGMGSGKSIGERIADFVGVITPLGAAMDQLSRSNVAGRATILLPVPEFKGSLKSVRAQVTGFSEVYDEVGRIVGIAERAAALPEEIRMPTISRDDLRQMMQSFMPMSSNNDEVVSLLRSILVALSRGSATDSPLSALVAQGGH